MKATSFSFLKSVWHVSSEDFIPSDEEWLREVVLVAIELMMNIMVSSVVPEEEMKYVSGEPKAAVIIDAFDGGE